MNENVPSSSFLACYGGYYFCDTCCHHDGYGDVFQLLLRQRSLQDSHGVMSAPKLFQTKSSTLTVLSLYPKAPQPQSHESLWAPDGPRSQRQKPSPTRLSDSCLRSGSAAQRNRHGLVWVTGQHLEIARSVQGFGLGIGISALPQGHTILVAYELRAPGST